MKRNRAHPSAFRRRANNTAKAPRRSKPTLNDQRNIHTPSIQSMLQHRHRSHATTLPSLMSPSEANEPTDVTEIQTARLRRESSDGRTVIVSITEAIRAAGLEDGGSFRFDPGAVETLGMLPAVGSRTSVDGRGEPLARNIRREGNQQSTLRLVIPRQALAALLDPDEIDWEDPPQMNVWAGDRLLAFEMPEKRSMRVNRDGYRRSTHEWREG